MLCNDLQAFLVSGAVLQGGALMPSRGKVFTAANLDGFVVLSESSTERQEAER